MKLSLLNSSVVVLANAHNPTILHPVFLVTQGIVPKEWNLAEPPVCTPAISVVKFANEIVFTAESSKLVILDNAPKLETPIPDLCRKYMELLPHVRYTAVGINFAGFVECPDPQRWLVERFVKEGAGNDKQLQPVAVGIKFVYSLERGVLNFSCDPGSVNNTGENVDRPCVLINANYHLPIRSEKATEETLAALSTFKKLFADCMERAQNILGLEK